MSQRTKTRGKGVMGFILVLLIGSFGLLSWWSWATKPYSPTGNQETISIAKGTTVAQLAEELQKRHLIRSAWAFKYLARGRDAEFKIYVGHYLMDATMSPNEIIERLLNKSALATNRVTIPEGYTTRQVIDLLVQKGIGNKVEFSRVVMEDDFDYPFLKDAPKGAHRLEGYLFPNTYDIPVKTNPHAVIELLLQQFAKELNPDVQAQLDILKLSVSQWVTVGSMVEKEASKEADRPLIASVVMNRLKINQPLQIDATIQFLLDNPRAKLYTKDLQISSPYNTYLNSGLPLGPIANPGHASLQAALYPAQTDFLYYVAKKDGYHEFAKTYAEHLKNIKLYLE